jgi:hypothetical protein
MHWTYDDLMSTPEDVVADLAEKWRAERIAKRMRSKNGRGE